MRLSRAGADAAVGISTIGEGRVSRVKSSSEAPPHASKATAVSTEAPKATIR